MKTIKKRPLRKKKILSKILRKYRRKKNIIGGTAKKIPKIVHQIWIGENKRPDIWMDTVKKFCNDYGYEYKLWDEKMGLDLIKEHYPWFLKTYEKYDVDLLTRLAYMEENPQAMQT